MVALDVLIGPGCKRQVRGEDVRTISKRLYVGLVSFPSSIACFAVFQTPAVGVVADGDIMPRMLLYFPAAMAATVLLREKEYSTGNHIFDWPIGRDEWEGDRSEGSEGSSEGVRE